MIFRGFSLLLLLLAYVSPIWAFSYPSSSAQLSENITFYWEFLNNNTLMMAVNITTDNVGWLGLGLGGAGMLNVDMVTFEQSNGSLIITDRYATAYAAPAADVDLGGNQSFTLVAYDLDPNRTYIHAKFWRLLDTGDPYDTVISKQQGFLMSWAYGTSDLMTYHGPNVAMVQINLNDTGLQESSEKYSVRDILNAAHKIGQAILWGVVIDIPFLTVLFFRTWKYFAITHAIISSVVGGFGTTSVLIQTAYSFSSVSLFELSFKSLHAWLGFLIGFLSILQMIYGIRLYLKISSPKTESDAFQVLRTHKWMGYILYGVAKLNVAVGIGRFAPFWLKPLLIYYFIILVNNIIIIGLVYKKKAKAPVTLSRNRKFDLSLEQMNLMNMLRNRRPLLEMNNNLVSLNWVLYNDFVVDLGEDFLHPGGNFIIQKARGREVSRFLHGAYMIEDLQEKPHVHSSMAIQLLNEHIIGSLEGIYPSIFQPEEPHNADVHDSLLEITSLQLQSTIVNKVNLNSNVTRIDFEFSKMNIKIKYEDPAANLGRHFLLSHVKNPNVKRNYTLVLSQTPEMTASRNRLINLLDGKKSDQNIGLQDTTKTLPLFVKNYDRKGGLSKLLHQSTMGDSQFIFEGPHGLGLNLNQQLQGDITVLAAGTGFLPFLDLLDLWFRWSAIKELYKKGIDARNEWPGTEEFSSFTDPKLKIQMIVCFKSIGEFIGEEFIERLSKLQEGNFKMMIRIADEAFDTSKYNQSTSIKLFSDRLSPAFFKANCMLTSNRFLICGPPSFNQEIPVLLKEQGIFEDLIELI